MRQIDLASVVMYLIQVLLVAPALFLTKPILGLIGQEVRWPLWAMTVVGIVVFVALWGVFIVMTTCMLALLHKVSSIDEPEENSDLK